MAAIRLQNKNTGSTVSDCDKENTGQYLFTRDHHFTCRGCHQFISSRELNKHHLQYHPEVPLQVNIFEVSEVKNFVYKAKNDNLGRNEVSAFNTEHQFICGACFQNVTDLELNYHHNNHHPDIPLDVNIYEPLNINDISDPCEGESADASQCAESVCNTQKYICGACTQNVQDEKLDHNHFQHHPDIPLDVNIYEVVETDQLVFI